MHQRSSGLTASSPRRSGTGYSPKVKTSVCSSVEKFSPGDGNLALISFPRVKQQILPAVSCGEEKRRLAHPFHAPLLDVGDEQFHRAVLLIGRGAAIKRDAVAVGRAVKLFAVDVVTDVGGAGELEDSRAAERVDFPGEFVRESSGLPEHRMKTAEPSRNRPPQPIPW